MGAESIGSICTKNSEVVGFDDVIDVIIQSSFAIFRGFQIYSWSKFPFSH